MRIFNSKLDILLVIVVVILVTALFFLLVPLLVDISEFFYPNEMMHPYRLFRH